MSMDAQARHRMLLLAGVPVAAMYVPPRAEVRASNLNVLDDDEESVEEDVDLEEGVDLYGEGEPDDSEDDEDLDAEESEEDDDEPADEEPDPAHAAAQARHRTLELLGVDLRSALHPASNPAPGRQVITQAGSHRFKLPIGSTILADGMVLFHGRKMSRHEATQLYHEHNPDRPAAPAKAVTKAAPKAAKAPAKAAPAPKKPSSNPATWKAASDRYPQRAPHGGAAHLSDVDRRHDEATAAGLSHAEASAFAMSEAPDVRAWQAAKAPAKKATPAKAAPTRLSAPEETAPNVAHAPLRDIEEALQDGRLPRTAATARQLRARARHAEDAAKVNETPRVEGEDIPQHRLDLAAGQRKDAARYRALADEIDGKPAKAAPRKATVRRLPEETSGPIEGEPLTDAQRVQVKALDKQQRETYFEARRNLGHDEAMAVATDEDILHQRYGDQRIKPKAAKKAASGATPTTSAPEIAKADAAGLTGNDRDAYLAYVRDHPGASVEAWRAASGAKPKKLTPGQASNELGADAEKWAQAARDGRVTRAAAIKRIRQIAQSQEDHAAYTGLGNPRESWPQAWRDKFDSEMAEVARLRALADELEAKPRRTGGAARHRELQLLGIETRATAHTVQSANAHPVDTERLRLYWTKNPEGLAKWATSPHPWTALREHLAKFIHNPGELDRTTSAWHFDVFHQHTGSDAYRLEHGGKMRGHRIGVG